MREPSSDWASFASPARVYHVIILPWLCANARRNEHDAIEGKINLPCATGLKPVEVYVDGGIDRGRDIFKALALGARAVLVGRPMIYGMAVRCVAHCN